MGKLSHVSLGNPANLDDQTWNSTATHLLNGSASIDIIRSDTLRIVAADATANSKAGADTLCTGTATSPRDELDINAAIDA